VFTAQYTLKSYIKQIRFIFKGLKKNAVCHKQQFDVLNNTFLETESSIMSCRMSTLLLLYCTCLSHRRQTLYFRQHACNKHLLTINSSVMSAKPDAQLKGLSFII
jgi:hypothetical protein